MNHTQNRSNYIVSVKANLEQSTNTDLNKRINKSNLLSQRVKLLTITICVLVILFFQDVWVLEQKPGALDNFNAKNLEDRHMNLPDLQGDVNDKKDVDKPTQTRGDDNQTSKIIEDRTILKEKDDVIIVKLKYEKDDEQTNLPSNLRVERNPENNDVKLQEKDLRETPDKRIGTKAGITYQEGNQVELTKQNSPNVFFYRDLIPAQPEGVFLDAIHETWRGDYDKLESSHTFIQWLFPNFYKSKYNSASHKLEKHEAEIFRTDLEIAKKLLKSYELILDFYGMKMINPLTGKLQRNINYKLRYEETLIRRTHNHLRISRILTHLNNVGLRKYAIELVSFLEEEIYGEVGGYKKYRNNDLSFNEDAFMNAPLEQLARKNVFEKWDVYGDHREDFERKRKLNDYCFSNYPEDFKESILFSNL